MAGLNVFHIGTLGEVKVEWTGRNRKYVAAVCRRFAPVQGEGKGLSSQGTGLTSSVSKLSAFSGKRIVQSFPGEVRSRCEAHCRSPNILHKHAWPNRSPLIESAFRFRRGGPWGLWTLLKEERGTESGQLKINRIGLGP